jgi:hypothetical protein
LSNESVIRGYCQRRKAELNQNDHEKLRVILTRWFDQHKLLENLGKMMKELIIPLQEVCYVTSTLNLLTGVMLQYSNKTLSDADYERCVLFAIAWGVAGTYENSDRMIFNEWLS